jgi:outer membrane lipoprotein-sorting protein
MFLLKVLIGAALLSHAQEKQLDATDLAKQLQSYKSVKSLEATFKQTKSFKDMTVKLKSEGHFQLDRKNQKVVWEILKPSRLKVLLGKDEIRIEAESQKEHVIRRNEIGNDKAVQSLAALVTWLEMDPSKLIDQYSVFQQGISRFHFVPKTSGFFKSVDVALNSKGFVTQMVIHEASGDEILIDFGEPKVRVQN